MRYLFNNLVQNGFFIVYDYLSNSIIMYVIIEIGKKWNIKNGNIKIV